MTDGFENVIFMRSGGAIQKAFTWRSHGVHKAFKRRLDGVQIVYILFK